MPRANDTERPQLEALLSFIREGDTLVAHSMDRLAKNLDDLRRLVQGLNLRAIFLGRTTEVPATAPGSFVNPPTRRPLRLEPGSVNGR
jgi:hypothetical protein